MQIGNEINVGMLWPDGKVQNNDFTNLSLLLKAGYNATKACNGSTQVIIHTADADSQANSIPGTTTCDGQPATPQGRATEFAWVQNTARNAGAIGVFYWEPTWCGASKGNGWDPADINGTGNGWDDMATFDASGRVNPAIRWTP